MKGYLLDTNVLSEVMKKRPARTVMQRLAKVPKRALFTSSVCVMELRFGAARAGRIEALWHRIESEFLVRVRVSSIGSREASRAGDILAALEARGETIGIEDVLIAATALENDLVVVTRNERHLARVSGLTIENWWS